MQLKHIEKITKKLLKSYNYISYFFSGLKQKDKNLWVFGTYNDGFSDNSKYLYLHVKEHFPEIDAIWITRTRSTSESLNKKGITTKYKLGKEGKRVLESAYYHFTNTNLIDTDIWRAKNAKYVNLWHGLPLKKIEFDITKGTISWKYQSSNPAIAFIKKIAFPALYRNPDYLLCPSDELATIMKRSFRVDDGALIYYPYPRNIVFEKSKEELRLLINNFETNEELALFDNLCNYKKKFIYLPTFRDGKSDFIRLSGIDFIKLNDSLKTNNSILIVKLHPNIKLLNTSYSNIKFLKSCVDIYPFLPIFDCLITDYSSVFFDFLISDKKIIFYCFDKTKYLNSLRGINFDYDSITPGEKCYCFNELLSAMYSESDNYRDERKKIKKMFWDKRINKSVDDMVYFLKDKAK